QEQAGQWSRVAWFLLLFIFHRRAPSEYTELQKTFWDTVSHSKFRVDKEVSGMAVTMAELVREEGREEGRGKGLEEGLAAGREEGQLSGLRLALLELLEARFGSVSAAIRAQIDGADREQLLRWMRRAGVSKSLAEIGFLAG
ncbi:MAG: putative transposase, partial [Armatimonadetes bacterium]|nr:putative transposase [Armatimonadota bacterium]